VSPAPREKTAGVWLGAGASPLVSGGLNRNGIITLLVCYFLLHLAIRCVISSSAELDESEQLVLGQAWRWGYGPQPPLYTWLQATMFLVFGTNVFALALLKNLLLFSLYYFTYLGAKEISGEEAVSLAAMSALFFMPQIAWESQRDLTHTVLVSASIAWTLYVLIRLLKTRRTCYYLLLGLCAGVGVLAKANFGIFLAGVVLAALSIGRFKAVVSERRILLTLGGFLAITSGYVLWALHHVDATLSRTGKLSMGGEAAGSLVSCLMGLADLGKGVATILLPSLFLYGVVLYRAPLSVAPTDEESDYRKLVGRVLVAGVIITAAMILIFKVSNVKERWIQPLLIPAPVYLALYFRRRMSPERARRIVGLAGLVMVVVLFAVPSRSLLASYFGRQPRLNAPYSELAKQLENAGFDGGLIVAEDRLVGGNMKLFFKQSVVIVPELPALAGSGDLPRLIVWSAKDKDSIPLDLVDFVKSRYPLLDLSSVERHFVDAPYHYSLTERMRLGFILIGTPRRDE
jgi:4-amino-4-deoxy-L-arabinose transferase-like glycosyltransferase